ncbi:MAG: glycerol kinase GlpK [Chloroflexi bacterium]|nr:glycerol kinase GlpK [Chloroflexota bacterium]
MRYVAAIDQGTTGTRCMVFDHNGLDIGRSYKEHEQILPRPGWIEHDPLEIWHAVQETVHGALAQARITAADVVALGITNQRETTVIWDRHTGRPYHNAVVWQCMRTQEICQRLQDDGLEPFIRERTGLLVSVYFSGPKIRWLLDHVAGLRQAAERGDALFGTIDSWLIWNLTGGPRGGVHVTDVTNASRTMLMNLATREWDDELLRMLEIPRSMLPEIRPSSDSATYGSSPAEMFGHPMPVCGCLGDQQGALAGQTCFLPGEAKNTYGTGSFLLMNTGGDVVPSHSGLLSTVAYGLSDGTCAYALEGSIAVTGAAVQWLRDSLGMVQSAAETETIASTVADNGGVYFVPAFSGLFAPYWDMYARGAILGLTRFASKAHIVRATLESICYSTRDVLEAMEADSGIALRSLKVDGGASANNLLMQLQADVLNKQVIRPTVGETTALGSAYMAGLAAGYWSGLDDLKQNWQVQREFSPSWSEERRLAAYAGWKRAVGRARGWLQEGEQEA